ncbi:RecQ family ATP-dependent DNA helicase [Promicromonospora sp. Populi]|uniref:RecQ family ATP-dependent DNA helicase n=1 Tax=Promicromonospora sp. Populi TaxID=3239420 RepID=UPI0034E1A26B
MTKDPFADLPFQMEEPPDDAALLFDVGDAAPPPSLRNAPEDQAAKLRMLRGLLDEEVATREPAPVPKQVPAQEVVQEVEQESTPQEPVAGETAPEPPARAVPAAAPGDSLRAEAEAALRQLVGRDDARLRDDQWTAIEALAAFHRRALVVQRTGWGKSAVYFVATRLLRARGAGPTVIVSPLLALMRDQIAAAARAGIRAVTINSANMTEWDEVHASIARGEVDVLLCSPERLNNPGFRDEVLPRLAADAGLVVIDEAHCISDWGHDFRPDYRRIRTLLADLPAGIPVLATTATANERVTQDVAEQLAVHGEGADAEEVLVLRGGLDRESLYLAVLELGDQPTRVAWLAEALQDIDGSGIVYCLTVSAAEQVAEQLRGYGLAVASYTGRTEPTQREQLEADLKNNDVKALVATSALGMGFDKPDLAFVVHLGAPSSPIAYYQQVGRAGRGVDQALVVLLPGQEDKAIWDWFGEQAFPAEGQVRVTLDALAGGGTMSTAALETQVDLRRNRLETMLKVLDVDGAVRRVRGGWEATGQQWSYDAERYARVAATRSAEQQAMVDYVNTQGCRMAYLRAQLDDPDLQAGWQCGRCDRCGVMELPEAPDVEAVAAARAEMDRPGVEVETRKMWPTGLASIGLDLKGKIAPAELAETGRAVARLDGLGWSGPLRDLLAPGAADGELPVPLRRAAARVLDEWSALHPADDPAEDGATGDSETGEAEPAGAAEPGPLVIEAVVAVRSIKRPQLSYHLATGLAKYLGVPMIGAIGPVAGQEEPGRHDLNSAMRLAGVARRLQLQLGEGALRGLPGRSVLLVDDYTDSGWTLTVASRLLRQAGAAAVYPFVLGVR